MEKQMAQFQNPFRPGAGHTPPYLAGRRDETAEFKKILKQNVVLENLVLTGLRGLGKTVLLETFKPIAIQAGWLWAGTDLSESASISEDNLATRLLTDLSVVTSSLVLTSEQASKYFGKDEKTPKQTALNYQFLSKIYAQTPGLASDKLKAVLETVWFYLKQLNKRGVVFAYDEAQNLSDNAAKDQYPLSLLLDVFQSIQRKEIPFMLALTGLPTLFPKLVEARTFAERMFRVVTLKPLNSEETEAAIREPVKKSGCPVKIVPESVKVIWEITHGYPYFIQYVCREAYDVWVQSLEEGTGDIPSIPVKEILRKLDSDFFAGRWAKATDRQRDLLAIIAQLPNAEGEFTVQETVEFSDKTDRPFGASQISQMLSVLSDAGLVYKNRHGKYSLAVPLMSGFIKRQQQAA
jgi:hypothetical protein